MMKEHFLWHIHLGDAEKIVVKVIIPFFVALGIISLTIQIATTMLPKARSNTIRFTLLSPDAGTQPKLDAVIPAGINVLNSRLEPNFGSAELLFEQLADGSAAHQRISLFSLSNKGEDAARELAKMGTTVIPILKELLSDRRGIVRGNAALALGFIKNPKTIENISVLLDDRDVSVRLKAVVALTEFPDMRSTLVIAGATGDEDPEVRGTALRFLSLRNYPSKKGILYAALSDDHWFVRSEALAALENSE